MEMSSPRTVITRLVAAMNAQDLETAMALFEPGAMFVMKPVRQIAPIQPSVARSEQHLE